MITRYHSRGIIHLVSFPRYHPSVCGWKRHVLFPSGPDEEREREKKQAMREWGRRSTPGNREGEEDEDEGEQEEAASGRTTRVKEEREALVLGRFSKCMWPTDGLSCCPSPLAHRRTILCTYLFSKTGCC